MYSPEGFTRRGEIKAILDRLEPDVLEFGAPNGTGGAYYFAGLTPEEGKRLLGFLPPAQAGDSQESSPTFQEMIALGERFPDIPFLGTASLRRDNERITIEGSPYLLKPQRRRSSQKLRSFTPMSSAGMKVKVEESCARGGIEPLLAS